MTLPAPFHRDLVIVRAGKTSLHPNWLAGGVPRFDLLVSAYEAAAPGGTFRLDIPGTKIAGYAETFSRAPEIFERYEQIALIDNDMDCDAATINECFAIGRKEKLEIWQPALSIDSYFTYAITVRNPLFRLRHTDFVEMMCPFFAAPVLQELRPLFTMGYETAIDLVWVSRARAAAQRAAVVDATPVRHTRPVGGTRAEQGFSTDQEGYAVAIAAFTAETGAAMRYPRAVAGRTRGGLVAGPSLLLDAAHLPIVRGLWASPQGGKAILRALYHHMGFGSGRSRRRAAELR